MIFFIKTSIYKGFSMAMLNNQTLTSSPLCEHLSASHCLFDFSCGFFWERMLRSLVHRCRHAANIYLSVCLSICLSICLPTYVYYLCVHSL